MGLFKKNNLILIGDHHIDESHDAFKTELVKKASLRDIVLGIEGCVRDEEHEAVVCRDKYGIEDKGHVYGYEEERPLIFSSAWLQYIGLGISEQGYPPEIVEYMIAAKTHSKTVIIGMLSMYESMQRHFKSIKEELESEDAVELYNKIDKYLDNIDDKNKHDEINKFMQENYKGSDTAWVELLKHMLRPITDDSQDLLQWHEQSMIEQCFEDPEFDSVRKYIGFHIALEWRGHFMHREMKNIANIARQEDKDVYFMMGTAHVKDISKKFGLWSMGFHKHTYFSYEDIPNEFMP